MILDEIRIKPQVALGLPMPQDLRLLKITRALSDQPGDRRRLEEWAIWANIAPRTLSRRFVAETGFSFTEWRQRVRMLRALELLASGRSVTAIALDLGYDNASAFIALFRRMFGVTPGRYAPLMC
ncbi:helix-turn-helix domain-containing protein [Halomonas cupida]|uniref:helix-turn-helix domain-containing protein n=1 Tax=Halomonas cupida TaxID=44933 RepID=UPI001F47F459|nr:helix-turn-helix domain-containing protein [Halomonas cupida]